MEFKSTKIFKIMTALVIISSVLFVGTFATLIYVLVGNQSTIPPKAFVRAGEISGEYFSQIVRRDWPHSIPITHSDSCVVVYSLEDFQSYRNYLKQFKFNKGSEQFNDCDDFAAIAYGREREWFTSHEHVSNCGSSFGIIRGILNLISEGGCEVQRNHAMNIFVDVDLNVWGYEPQNDNLYKFPDVWCNNTKVDGIYL